MQIEDLKAQLDDALGAEDLLVQLTERNLMLGEVSNLPLSIDKWWFMAHIRVENRGDAHHHRGLGSAQRTQR